MTRPGRSLRSGALDAAVGQARALRLDDAVVRARADECVRWTVAAERAPRRFAWWWPAGAALATAALAAAAVAAFVVRPGAHTAAPPEVAAAAPIVGVGARVAIVASPGAVYAVLDATVERTDISIASGAVTARLYPGAAPHQLRLVGGGVEATATGTIYTLAVPASVLGSALGSGAPYVVVHEGRVVVRDTSGERAVSAGQAWPEAAARATGGASTGTVPATASLAAMSRAALEAAAGELEHHDLDRDLNRDLDRDLNRDLAAAPPAPPAPAAGAAAPEDRAGSADARPDVPRGNASTGSVPAATAATAIAAATSDERWRRARQLRGQGHPREALAILDELIGRGDAVWSPIAIAEAMRIHASVLADPRAVIELGTRFVDGYPKHALIREVTDLLCRAHRALGATELPSACLLRGAE